MRRIAVFVLLLSSWAATASAWNSSGTPVCTATGFQGDLVAVPMPWSFEIFHGRNLFALWSDQRDTVVASPAGDLYFDVIDPDGPEPPSDGTPAVVAPGFQGYADACFTGYTTNDPFSNAGAIVVWLDNRNGALDVYAKRVLNPPNRTPWPSDGIPVCTASGAQNAVHVVGDVNAGATISWLDPRSGSNSIYAQRLDADGATQWAANGIPIVDVPAYRYQHKLAASPDGSACFVWIDDQGGPLQVRAARFLADGTRAPGWPANGLLVSTRTAVQLGPVLADGGGGIVVTFFTGDGHPMAAWIDASGAVHTGWPADGVALSASPVPGGAIQDAIAYGGGLAVLWTRNVTPIGSDYFEFDLIAQRIGSNGARPTGWGPDGNVMCDAPGTQTNARLAAGPFILGVWEDGRSSATGTDLYAMHLLDDGSPDPLWTANGVLLAGGAGRQLSPRPVWDDAGGVLVAYLDDHGNSNETDVYAQRVNLNGTVGTVGVTPIPPAGFRLGAPVPNPARSAVVLDLTLPAASAVSAEVLDALGRHVRALTSTRAAASTMRWDLGDDAGRRVEPGVYFIRVRSSAGTASRAVVVRR